MKTRKIKPTPITSFADFNALVAELPQLEAQKRAIEGDRDAAALRAAEPFNVQLAPIIEKINSKLALAEAFAESKRDELLPGKAKSATVPGARYGFRIGTPAVKLLSKVKEEHSINSLKALGLASYVRTTEEIAKDRILADCIDGKTLTVIAGGDRHSGKVKKTIPLSDAGLRIAQTEKFFVEPLSESAETLTPEKNQPVAVVA